MPDSFRYRGDGPHRLPRRARPRAAAALKSTVDFDPFGFNPISARLRDTPTRRLFLMYLAAVAVLVGVTSAAGTLGGVDDLQVAADLQRMTGLGDPAPSAPYFPLLRDVASWLLITSIGAGVLIVHQQWRLMSVCISSLIDNGALVAPTGGLPLNRTSRLMGINRMISGCTTTDALPSFVSTVNERMARWRWPLFLATAGLSVGLAALLLFGYKRGLFGALAPADLVGTARADWIRTAYATWWAADSHPAGFVLYALLTVVGIFIVLASNVVGVVVVYITIGLQFVCSPRADWLNRDGRYGWSPIARVYRTVLASLLLLGSTLAVTVVVLGLENFSWMALLVLMYAVVVPLFVVVPWVVFRRVETVARNERVKELVRLAPDVHSRTPAELATVTAVAAEIERCTRARIRPTRLRTASFSTFLVVVLLPVILAGIQILFP